MVRFKDLVFKPHDLGFKCQQAKVLLPNGYTVSIVTGTLFYCNVSKPYEIGVYREGKMEYIKGYLDAQEVDEYLTKIEQL